MVLEIIEMYGFEEGGGTGELKREISKLNHLMPNQKNTKSQQRIFTTICGVLGMDREYKNSVFASRFLNNKFDFIAKFLEPYSIFPERWNVENFMKLGNLTSYNYSLLGWTRNLKTLSESYNILLTLVSILICHIYILIITRICFSSQLNLL